MLIGVLIAVTLAPMTTGIRKTRQR
jgi:hypothetical protein